MIAADPHAYDALIDMLVEMMARDILAEREAGADNFTVANSVVTPVVTPVATAATAAV